MDNSLLTALRDQVDTILLILDRPIVQRQAGAFILVLFFAWLVPYLLRRSVDAVAHRRKSGRLMTLPSRWESWQAGLARSALALGYTLFPMLGLLFGHFAARLFLWWEWPAGLILRLLPLFWLLLAYRILAGFLFAFFERKQADRYHLRLLAPLSVILVVLILRTTLAGALPIGNLTLFTFLDTPVMIAPLFSAVVTLYLFWTTAWVVGGLLKRLWATTSVTGQGAANTLLTFSRYVIIGIGSLMAVSTLGFNLSALTIIGGGLSVGIGFGLQELVANFVSGILLLFEYTIRPGNVIEVAGHRGVIDQLRMRATVVRTANNVEVLIPNKNLLTSTMITYTKPDQSVERSLKVSVSAQNEPTTVRDLLLDLAGRHGQVLKSPAPTVFFTGFAGARLDFDLSIWVADPLSAVKVTSDLYFMIWSEFKKQNIALP
ncbi:MAG: mechanosensitive ion channel [Caldilineaceae bacterium]|nr:mechanosensitive ion channel [Caldilineaceae bacterium]